MLKEELLNLLKTTDGYLSGEELSIRFQVSRSAIWKNMKQLKQEGYQIASVTNRGYRLEAVPDKITPTEIRNGLSTNGIGHTIHLYDTVDSTNEEAKRQALQGAPHGSVFVAEHQTGGKGRLGRAWSSPSGTGIWFTLLIRPNAPLLHISNLTLVAGLAVSKAVSSLTGCDATIKWPNDVIIGSKKICGILTEMSAEIDKIHFLVIGIGVNVNTPEFPPELKQKATSLLLETGHKVSRVLLLQKILTEFELLYEQYLIDEHAFLPEYKKRCASLGKQVTATQKNITGTAVDIADSGELCIQDKDGKKHLIYAGEVTVQGIYE